VKNRSNIVLILLLVLGAVLVTYYYLSDDDLKYQWYENYRADNDQPYGLKFMKKLLESYRPNGKFVFNDDKSLKKILDSASIGGNADYIFIGQNMFLQESDLDALVNFVKSGNDALIISSQEPTDLLTRIYFKECGTEFTYYARQPVDSIITNFFHDTLKTSSGYRYRYHFAREDAQYYWQQVSPTVFCDATKAIVPLGYHNEGQVDFVKIPVEKGNVYLHCNPLLFTNYFLINRDKLDYAAGVFSHLRGNDIVWDEYSKIPLASNNNRNRSSSPLYYVLQQRSLKYAWWLLLITAVLYVFFAAKRKQRVIPVLEKKSNTSLEYVNLISTLHYKNGNHLDMARKKMKYFLYFIRSRYGVSTDSIKEEQIKRIAEKSKMNVEDVRIIFDQYQYIERFTDNIEANRLLNLYYAIENFYQKCK
jgi:hypothetical protein